MQSEVGFSIARLCFHQVNAELDIVCTENLQYAEKSFNIGTNLKNKMIFALFRFFLGLFDAIKNYAYTT
jgi:hypothetical protein